MTKTIYVKVRLTLEGDIITDNDIKARVIRAINQFFSIDNWDFGDTFYFTELSTYIMNQLMPYVNLVLIVPRCFVNT